MSALDEIFAKDASEIDVLEWAIIISLPREKAEEAAEKLVALREAAGALKELWQYVLDNSGDDCGCESGDYSVGIYPSGPCSHCKTKAALAALENK